MKKRVGDTLVEVALAIGIFSMVAIAVVSVMTGGTSSAETALETTLAREEIDVQAEALRFVHSAYIAGADSGEESPYVELWDKIVEKAIDPSTDNTNYLEYAPRTCQEVQDSDTLKNHGFIINPRALSSRPSEAYVGYNNNNFKTASTFPRLIYSANDGSESLLGSTGSNLYRAEGIYVIAVKDASTTQIVGTTSPSLSSGFYDFYIRTCWYGVGEDTPSTISTVIRLYDPPEAVNRNKSRVTIVYMSNGGPSVPVARQIVYPGESVYIPRYENNAGFVGWNLKQDLSGGNVSWENNLCKVNNFGNATAEGTKCKYTAPKLSANSTIYLYAMWNEEIKIELTWGSTHSDLDSYVKGLRTDGQSFEAYYSNKTGNYIAGQPPIAILDKDCTGSCRTETFTINTLGADKYYYYVKNYTNKNSNITDATVKVTSSGKLNLNKTFTASNATGDGGAWNVFAFIDDKIIPCEIRTAYNSPNTSYNSPCRPFTIQFNGNGNTGGGMANQTINYGTSAALANNAFSRTGYAFKGWNTKANGTGTSYSNRASYRAPTSADSGTIVTLYAQWDKQTYRVIFDPNGGAGSMPNQFINRGVSQALNTNTFTYANYVFKGWNTQSNGNGSSYTDGQSVINLAAVNGSITLYAQWQRPLQDWTGCQNMSIGDTATLVDLRDDNEYLVGKLADNKCWMLSNLRLDPTAVSLEALQGKTNAENLSLNYLKNGGGRDPYATAGVRSWNVESGTRTAPLIMDIVNNPRFISGALNSYISQYGADSIGIYYNYCAISAGSHCNPYDSPVGASQDLCPSGWRLPSLYDNSSDYINLASKYKGSSFNDAFHSIPLVGYMSSNGFFYDQGQGVYWSSSAVQNIHFWGSWYHYDSIYVAYIGLYNSFRQTTLERSNHATARCIKK